MKGEYDCEKRKKEGGNGVGGWIGGFKLVLVVLHFIAVDQIGWVQFKSTLF